MDVQCFPPGLLEDPLPLPPLPSQPVEGPGMNHNSHAYNSVWQMRGDAWCRLEEAADRLTRPTTSGQRRDEYIRICTELLDQLTPLEPYWAYPGTTQFTKLQRLFAAGHLDKFARAVSRINRALATFVTPYPPGFPVLVPGQVFSQQILSFIRGLDTPEIHG